VLVDGDKFTELLLLEPQNQIQPNQSGCARDHYFSGSHGFSIVSRCRRVQIADADLLTLEVARLLSNNQKLLPESRPKKWEAKIHPQHPD
jgi:hypothetical protein